MKRNKSQLGDVACLIHFFGIESRQTLTPDKVPDTFLANFQSDDTLKMKLGMTITSLGNGRWLKITGSIEETLQQLNAMFEARFEKES